MLDQPEADDHAETSDSPASLDDGPVRGAGPLAVWWPVLGASVVIALFSVAVSVAQVGRAYPHDQWESIVIADAYRYSVGLPAYTNPETEAGHATHFYGPLMIYAVGLLFKWKGVSVGAAHLISLVSSVWVVAALAVIYFRGLPWVARIAGVALLLSVNGRLHGMFTQIHPDMPAMGFSVLALIFMFQAVEGRRWVWLPLALGCFCVAYLFKQTFAVFTVVPLLSLLLRREWSVGSLVGVIVPPVTVIVLIVVVSVVAPNVHYHMITAVRRWPMRFDVLAVSPLRFLGYYVLLPMATCVILVRPISFTEPRVRWLIAAGVGALPTGLLAYSKLGGRENSFVPALMPLIVLSTLGVAAAWEAAAGSLVSPARVASFVCLIALVMLADGLETSREAMSLYPEGNGDEHYPQVVECVRKLKGRVLCPEDPTVPIVALGQVGRSYWAESDVQLQGVPLHLMQVEILGADYVILLNAPNKIGRLTGDTLGTLGFVRASWDGGDMGIYELWRKRPVGKV